jgi:hypothetical protein
VGGPWAAARAGRCPARFPTPFQCCFMALACLREWWWWGIKAGRHGRAHPDSRERHHHSAELRLRGALRPLRPHCSAHPPGRSASPRPRCDGSIRTGWGPWWSARSRACRAESPGAHMAASCRQSANSSCSRPIHDGRPSHSASWSRAVARRGSRCAGGRVRCVVLLAQRGLGQLLHRGGMRCRCAHGRRRCRRAITWRWRELGGGGRCAVVAQRRLQCSSNGGRRDKGRGLSTWTRAPHQMESGCPPVSGPGAPPACFGALPVSAPTLAPRTARGETSCVALSCAARWRARKQLRLPGTSTIYRAPQHAVIATSRGCIDAVVWCASSPAPRPQPPELEHHRYHRMHLVPYHSRRLSSPYHSTVSRFTLCRARKLCLPSI